MCHNAATIMIFNTLMSTHAGSGTQLSYVDLPIQREVHTDIPKIEASTLKGCIRYALRNEDTDLVNRLLGAPDKGEYASAVAFSDARLLFFPVKSVKGIFAWVTCPFVLQRFLGDYKTTFGRDFCGQFDTASMHRTYVTNHSELIASDSASSKIMLEEYTFDVETSQEFDAFIQEIAVHLPNNRVTQERIPKHVVLLSDYDFTGFVKYSTEVNTRIKMDPDKGTVDGTALFTEEFLPPECILYNMIFFTQEYVKQGNPDRLSPEGVKREFSRLFDADTFQIGGDATLGKGWVAKRFWEGESNDAE